MKFEYQGEARHILEELFGATIEFEDQLIQAAGSEQVSTMAIKPLSPGLSGAAIFLVRRLGASQTLPPWIAKASNQPNLIINERENNLKFVAGKVPSAPVLIPPYNARLLIFSFAGPLANFNPETLRNGYSKSSPAALKALMRRLVTDLRPLQSIEPDTASCIDRMPLLKDFDQLAATLTGLLPADVSQRLIDAWRTTVNKKSFVPLIRSKAHGDLNSGNILFEPGDAASIPVVIDFASMAVSKDNIGYSEEYFHFPFWDYAKVERDLQTRLFLKEALETGLSEKTLLETVRELGGTVDQLSNMRHPPVEKLAVTTTSLRKAVADVYTPQEIKGCYRLVSAYAMLSMLLRQQPDSEFPTGIQNRVAAESAIALLADPFGEFVASAPHIAKRPGLESPDKRALTLRLGLLRTDDSDFEKALLCGAKIAAHRFRQKHSPVVVDVIQSIPSFREPDHIKEALRKFHVADIDAVVGPCDSESAQQILINKMLDEVPIPLISPGASSPLLQQQPYVHPLFFRATSSDRDNLEDLVEWLLHSGEHHPVLVISETADINEENPLYGENLRNVFNELAEPKDLPIQRGLSYKRGQSQSLNEILAKRLSSKKPPRSIVLFGLSVDMVKLACEIRSLAPEMPLYAINPRRELFLSAGASYGCRDSTRLVGFRAVIDSSAEMVERQAGEHFFADFQKDCADELHDLSGTGMFGFDAATVILVRALEIAEAQARHAEIKSSREELATKLRTSRKMIRECLLSDGRFDDNQELFLRTKRYIIRDGGFVSVV